MRKYLALLATAAAIAAGTVTVTAAPAHAALRNCTGETAYSNKSSGTASLIGTGINYRTGPDHNTCTSLGTWNQSSGYYLYLWCYTYGSYVSNGQQGSNVWWFGRRSGTSQQGWISSLYTIESGTSNSDQC
ncbi:hypothetical protein F4553_001841 [Allocatelliglobosispora scoriae]|uniref:SH3 domain-containing protein n=1 Tax=Allocatelliglobosispora scoriae TaxID=643052 RepID=A0A841BNZ9_9ACTN|nr:hypothetical protein [Allocatelliglobosispora scoriae]MBB5868462.1 hypothetical protein [Allocatelliglobosispora scoriae]